MNCNNFPVVSLCIYNAGHQDFDWFVELLHHLADIERPPPVRTLHKSEDADGALHDLSFPADDVSNHRRPLLWFLPIGLPDLTALDMHPHTGKKEIQLVVSASLTSLPSAGP